MFIKIKLEPQSLKAFSSLKKISYFSIDDDATIINLKMKIEEYVDVPAERQEIRTLNKVFQNCLILKEVCDVRGYALMLYGYDECEEPQFVCFLQIYTNELAVQQQELEERSNIPMIRNKLTTPHSSTSSVTLIADADTEEESDLGTVSGTDSSNSDTGSSTDNSESTCGTKRYKHEKKSEKQNKKLRVIASAGGQYSETLCQYLDEFPKCSKELEVIDESGSSKKMSLNSCSCKGAIENDSISLTAAINNIGNENNPSCGLNKMQSNIITTANNRSNNTHPCYDINPEIRDYLAIISPTDTNVVINNTECDELLMWFFQRFRICDSSSQLQFDAKNAVSMYEGKLWIACMDMNTFQWISANVTQYTPKSYHVLALKHSKHLCQVVVPVVSNSKNILDIFQLLEKQNKNISTLKWSLQSRQELSIKGEDYNEMAVSTFCTNELFKISMDMESEEYLKKLDFKLKYGFWHIVFKFI